MTLTDKVSKPLKAIGSTFNNVATQAKNNTILMGAGFTAMLGAVVGINKLVEPARQMNQALTDVKGYGVTEQALKNLNKAALDFGTSYGGDALNFVKSSETVIKSVRDLTDTQLVSFTKASNLLATATKNDATTMASYLGSVYNSFSKEADKIGRSQWAESFASQSALASKMFGVSSGQLAESFKSAGSIGSMAGIDQTQQLAIYSTLGNTMEGNKAGEGLKAIIENASTAAGKLGMKFTDSQGRLLPMLDIVEKLGTKFGDLSIDKNAKALRDAFGGKAAESLTELMKNTGKLRTAMGQLGNVHGLEHVQKIAEQSVDPWAKFNGQVQALRITFGQALLPVLNPILEKITDVGKTLSKWSIMFPNITKLVAKFALIILGTTAVMGALTLGIGLFKNAFLALSIISKVTKAVVLFNIALWSNPITWIVAGIVALIAVIGAAIYYWDDITAAISNFTSFITDKLFSGLDWLLEKFNALSEWFTSTKSWTGLIKNVWTGLLKIIAAAIDTIIEYINYIPGVNIKFRASNYVPDFSAVEEQGEKAKQAGQAVINAQKTNTSNDGGAINKAINGVQLLSAQQQPTKQVHIENFNVTSSKSIDNTEMDNLMQMATGG